MKTDKGRRYSMKMFAIPSFCLAVLMGCSPPADRTHHEVLKGSSELVVVGKLQSLADAPYCGFIYFGGVAKYSDLQIVKGEYGYKEIFVVHGCPDQKQFKIGGCYELRLSQNNVHHIEQIVGDKGVPAEELYFCVDKKPR